MIGRFASLTDYDPALRLLGRGASSLQGRALFQGFERCFFPNHRPWPREFVAGCVIDRMLDLCHISFWGSCLGVLGNRKCAGTEQVVVAASAAENRCLGLRCPALWCTSFAEQLCVGQVVGLFCRAATGMGARAGATTGKHLKSELLTPSLCWKEEGGRRDIMGTNRRT
jgi:hypothetical protein